MSDSGSSQFPTRPPSAALSILPVKGEVKVQIIDATGKLARVDTPQTVIGEVSKVNKDGTVEVKTDQGALTLKQRERVVPAEGQRVEIDVAPGAPPKQATLRPAPVQTPQPDIPVRPAPTAPLQQQATDKPVTRPPLDQTMKASLNQQQAQRPNIKPLPVPTVPQPLPEDAIVRLTPLPPAQAKQLVDQIIQTLQTRMMSSAFLSTQAVQNTMAQELTAMVPALPRATIQGIVQQATATIATKTPLTHLNDTVNGTTGTTALTPALQTNRSPVENFMRQTLTQGTIPTLRPSHALSAQIMMPQANTTTLLPSMNIPAISQLSLMPVALPGEPAPPVTVSPALKPGMFVDARIQNFTPVTATLTPVVQTPAVPMILQSATASAMTAQVVTVTPQQFPVISLMMPGANDPQLFTLNFPATNLIPGSSFTVLPQQPVMPTAISTTPPSVFELLTGFRWPAFDEFMDLESIQFPGSPATQTLANILPNPAQPGKIPAAALLFIAAVKAGDLNAWLGDKNIESLRRMGKAEFVSRMMREFSGLNKLASEPVTPEWRGISIPMYGEGQVDKVHLYYRHSNHGDDRDQAQAEKGKGTRFIMDLNLSQMGEVQLDGYVRGKVVDLAVRTQRPFSTAMRHDMTQRYIQALENAGFEGALIFQAQPDKFVKIVLRPDLLSASV